MVDSTLLFLVDLFLLLGGAVAAGEIAAHFGQPAMVGQLLVGIFLGPTLLGPYVGLASLGPDLGGLQLLATVFVLFMAGLELSPEQIYRMSVGNLLLGIGLFFLPFLAGVGAVRLLYPGDSWSTVYFVAIALAITALPVMGIMLSEFGLTHSETGRILLNSALINEFCAVTVFALVLHVGAGSGPNAFVYAFGAVGAFLGLMFGIHFLLKFFRERRWWLPITRWFQRTWRSKQGGFALLMVLLLAATLLSQELGLTYVIGAFYAGLLVTRESAGEEAHESISQVFDSMTWGFFVPLFFAFVGVQMNLRLLNTPIAIAILVALFGVASASKIGTGFFGTKLLGWSRADALAGGFLVNSRGGVALAMAVILLTDGLIDIQLFTVIATVSLATSLLAPIGAVWAWRSDERSREALYARVPRLRPGATGAPRVLGVPLAPWPAAPADRARPSLRPVDPPARGRPPLPPPRKPPPEP